MDTFWSPPWVSECHPCAPECHPCAQTLRRGRNIWGGSPAPTPEGPGWGRGCSQGRPDGRAEESLRAGAGSGGAAATRRQPPDRGRPGGEASSRRKPSPAPARVGARSPPGAGDVSLPIGSPEGQGHEGAQYAPPRSAPPPPPRPARPRVAPSLAAALGAALEGLKGRAAPPPAPQPRRAARRDVESAPPRPPRRRREGDYNSRAPAPELRWKRGRCLAFGGGGGAGLSAEGCGVGLGRRLRLRDAHSLPYLVFAPL